MIVCLRDVLAEYKSTLFICTLYKASVPSVINDCEGENKIKHWRSNSWGPKGVAYGEGVSSQLWDWEHHILPSRDLSGQGRKGNVIHETSRLIVFIHVSYFVATPGLHLACLMYCVSLLWNASPVRDSGVIIWQKSLFAKLHRLNQKSNDYTVPVGSTGTELNENVNPSKH